MTVPTQPSRAPTLRLRVTAAAESIVRAGHPWVFAGSVREQSREGTTGELGVIFDRKDRFLAIGLFDPDSPIRLRVLHAGKPAALDDAWWRGRLCAALAKRQGLFDDTTTGFRWIHGESDGWPGLVLDRYASALVLKIYTAAWLPRLEDVTRLIAGELNPERIVVRFSRNILDAAKAAGWQDGAVLELASGTASAQTPLTTFRPSTTHSWDGLVTFQESGLRFEADVVRGQKTGFFLDQRENRRRVETLAAGRAVLNAFSFSGGFSLYAARGGATGVTDLDISAHALSAARRNFALNTSLEAVARCRHVAVQADAFEWLAGAPSAKFGMVILDPPSLARREAERPGAIQAYERLAGMGLKALKDDGVLVAASCSAHVTEEEFFGAVRRAAAKSGRRWKELQTTGHPPDHPATFAEARYLKCVFLESL